MMAPPLAFVGSLLMTAMVTGAEAQVSSAQVARAVVFLHVPSTAAAGDGSEEIGTGFLVEINDRVFLVTASHVAKLMSSKASLTLGVENDAARTIGVAELTSSAAEPNWIVHPVADVAVLPLRLVPAVTPVFAGRGLPPVVFVSRLEAPPRDRPLTVFGFPLGLGAVFVGPDRKISAISKESKAASGLITLPRFDTKKPTEFFVLDSPSVGGFSGGPVVILPAAFPQGAGIAFSAATLVVGLVHGTASDQTGGKLALVVPSAFITQTLEAAYNARAEQ